MLSHSKVGWLMAEGRKLFQATLGNEEAEALKDCERGIFGKLPQLTL